MSTLLRFLVLIPHRDCAHIIEEYRLKLFRAGFAGAYSFPAAAPLAVISGSLSKDELKEAARAVREASLQNGGKIRAKGTAEMKWPVFPEGFPLEGSFFGPLLDFPWNAENSGSAKLTLSNPKLLFVFPHPVLCTALSGPAFPAPGSGSVQDTPEAPELSFGAAMVSNLSLRVRGPCFFEWKLSAPAWLPAVRGRKSE